MFKCLTVPFITDVKSCFFMTLFFLYILSMCIDHLHSLRETAGVESAVDKILLFTSKRNSQKSLHGSISPKVILKVADVSHEFKAKVRASSLRRTDDENQGDS